MKSFLAVSIILISSLITSCTSTNSPCEDITTLRNDLNDTSAALHNQRAIFAATGNRDDSSLPSYNAIDNNISTDITKLLLSGFRYLQAIRDKVLETETGERLKSLEADFGVNHEQIQDIITELENSSPLFVPLGDKIDKRTDARFHDTRS